MDFFHMYNESFPSFDMGTGVRIGSKVFTSWPPAWSLCFVDLYGQTSFVH